MKKRPPVEVRLQKLLARRQPGSLWIGARRHLPHKTCDVCVWHDARNGEVRLAAYVPADGPPETLATLLGEAMLTPRCGRPACPTTVVVLSPLDMPPIEALGRLFDIEVLRLDDRALAMRMLDNLESLLDGPEPGYLDQPEVTAPQVAEFFLAARDLWWEMPWSDYTAEQKLVIESPMTGAIHLSILGHDEDTRGLVIQPDPQVSATILTLRFCTADEAGPSIVEEAATHRFKVLEAWPVLTRPFDNNRLADANDLALAIFAIEMLLHGLENQIPCETTVDGGPVYLRWLD